MSTEKRLAKRRQRRTFRVRNKFKSRGEKIRISVIRSLNHIAAQVIDDSVPEKSFTVASFSSANLKDKKAGDKTAVAKLVGVELGKLAAEKGVKVVFFDRGSFRYHGRVKALAEGLREGGLEF